MRLLHAWVTTDCVLDGCQPVYTQNEHSKTGNVSAITCSLQKWGSWFSVQHCHRWRVWCVTVTQNWKASHLNIVTPLLPGIKNSGLNLLLENACRQFSVTPQTSLKRSAWLEVQNLTYRLTWSPWRGWKYKSITFVAQKPMLLQHDNARPRTIVTTSAVILNVRLDVVPHPPYRKNLAPSAIWLIASLQYHLKGMVFTCHA
jgi:hypothetical protein